MFKKIIKIIINFLINISLFVPNLLIILSKIFLINTSDVLVFQNERIGFGNTFTSTDLARKNHVPCIIHVKEVTQPQGHTTSGSHERYKSKERLKWEKDNCCIKKMKEWIIENEICTLKELSEIEVSAERSAKESRDRSWRDYRSSINEDLDDALAIITRVAQNSPKNKNEIINIRKQLTNIINPLKSDIYKSLKYVQRIIRSENNLAKNYLLNNFLGPLWDKQIKIDCNYR